LPDRSESQDDCERCPYAGICMPGIEAKAVHIADDELVAMVERLQELKPLCAEYEEINDMLKAAMQDKERAIAGNWFYTGKWIDIEQKAKEASKSRQWRGKWNLIK
jgi:hypothetical protein